MNYSETCHDALINNTELDWLLGYAWIAMLISVVLRAIDTCINLCVPTPKSKTSPEYRLTEWSPEMEKGPVPRSVGLLNEAVLDGAV